MSKEKSNPQGKNILTLQYNFILSHYRHKPKSNHVSLCISFVLLMESCAHSTGYAKALKKYLDPVQVRASILRNEQGSDNVDLEGKVIMITG